MMGQGPDALPAAGGWAPSEDDLKAVVRSERGLALGFENDSELLEARETALNYVKGEMPDLIAPKGRSGAMSSDISDAVESILPDLVEIFVGGEDVATFSPRGPEDEKAAQQETDYVNHVVFSQNNGFMTLYSAIKDALISKLGIMKAWPEDCSETEEQAFQGKTDHELALAQIDGWEITERKPSEFQAMPVPGMAIAPPMAPPPGMGAPQGPLLNAPSGLNAPSAANVGLQQPAPQPMMPPPLLQLWDGVLTRTKKQSRVRIQAVPPEHFAVARDTVALADTTYCAMRSYPRAQELLADGYDPDEVDRLPPWVQSASNMEEEARDTAGEHDIAVGSGVRELRQVEIIEHYVRIRNEETDDLEIWRAVTGNDESVLLKMEKVSAIPFSTLTPYPVTHRLMGRSLADMLLEIQRIRTVLLRMGLDSGYFALNQRIQVARNELTETTIEDLLDNQPGRPVITKSGNGLTPIPSPGLGFDVWNALELTAVMGEQRSGAVRNAQGLNPDTLHDTAAGASMLMGAAQKRVRMIARIFAETGIKDLFLNVHALLRAGPAQPAVVRLRNSWVDVDPTNWGVRDDMDIHIGVGSGGRDHDIAVMQQVGVIMQGLVTAQGGPHGPIVTMKNLYTAADKMLSTLGRKDVDQLISDPSEAMQGPPPPPPPNPDLLKLQAQTQLQQAKDANEHQLNTMKAQADAQNQQAKTQSDAQVKQYQADLDAQLKREKMAVEAQLKREQMQFDAQVRLTSPAVRFGGEAG